MHDLIVELRSLTLGVGFFQWQYDHLQEVPEKLAERVIATAGRNGNGNGQKANGKNGK
jgi:elongation factor G